MKDNHEKNGKGPSINEAAMRTFCAQFSPPLPCVKTDRIDGVRHLDAWTTAYWNKAEQVGFTALTFAGKLRVIVDAYTAGQDAAAIGKRTAESFGLNGGDNGKG